MQPHKTIVYSLPSCVQCDMTKRFLKKNNIPFDEVDLSEDPDATERVKQMGYSTAPVIESPVGTWGGFKPDRLNQLVESQNTND